MNFSQIIAPTIKELFIERIEDLILSGEMPTGYKLPSERELADQMNISKTAVHSGITDMTRKGFLEVKPRKGVFVTDYSKRGTIESLVSIMRHNGGKLDERTASSMVEMRYALESIALKHVIESSDSRLIEILRKIEEDARAIAFALIPNYMELGEKYFQFHHQIMIASGNTIFPMVLYAFHDPSVAFWANSARHLGIQESIRRLSVFTDCIEKGDLEGAIRHLEKISNINCEIIRD